MYYMKVVNKFDNTLCRGSVTFRVMHHSLQFANMAPLWMRLWASWYRYRDSPHMFHPLLL